jgi:hypothetical protein
MIHLQKTMCYDVWTQRDSNIATGAVTYFLNVRLTKTRTLVFRFTKTIGLLTATLGVDASTSRKRSHLRTAAVLCSLSSHSSVS